MAQIVVRKLDDRVLAKIKARATANRRSTEAEVRDILSKAVKARRRRRPSLESLIGSGNMGRSQEEIDAYVRALRDEWNRQS